MRLPRVSATYTTLSAPNRTPVGPMISALGSVVSGKLLGMVRSEVTVGTFDPSVRRTIRTTLPPSTEWPLAITVPFSALVTEDGLIALVNRGRVPTGR